MKDGCVEVERVTKVSRVYKMYDTDLHIFYRYLFS